MMMGTGSEQDLEKRVQRQMGCMAGFFQIFDRHRLSSTKRLPCSPAVGTISDPEVSVPESPAVSREFRAPSPEPAEQIVAADVVELPPKSPLLLPIFNLKEGSKYSWKFNKEAPRLSLDSRATTDAKGGLHPKKIWTSASILSTASRCDSIGSETSDGCPNRSPSVIARLMGLGPLPNSSDSETEKKPELRRSSSESRASRDLFHSRFITEQPSESRFHNAPMAAHYADPRDHLSKNAGKAELSKASNRANFNSPSPWKAQHRKSFFDSGDVFPEPKQTVSVYVDIEKRLKVRGIDEPSKDLETLKQILEALQLKGLLHSKNPNQVSHRIFIYDESPIVVMQPSRQYSSSNSSPISRRSVSDYARPNGRNHSRRIPRNHAISGENHRSVSPRRDRNVRSPTRAGEIPSPATRNECNAGPRRSNSIVKPKPLSVETQRKLKNSADNRRVSPINSPKLNIRRASPDPTAKIIKNEKITTVTTEDGESSSISGSSITTSTDTERWKTVESKEGSNLLERCDKLLQSIAEMNGSDAQPSPVSVLDSSLYKDEPFTPSPLTARRNLDFKDESGELEEEIWSPFASSTGSKWQEARGDCDFMYIADILRASDSLSEDADIFLLLEKQQYLKGKDTSKASRLQRKLIFDATNEIIERNRKLPPWKVVSWTDHNLTKPFLDDVWSELQTISNRGGAEDLFEVICGVLRKDLAGDELTGWGGDHPTEMSEAVLDIERLIFKDLVNGMIHDLAALASDRSSRRKLVF